jgi:hypothetical protein
MLLKLRIFLNKSGVVASQKVLVIERMPNELHSVQVYVKSAKDVGEVEGVVHVGCLQRM